MRAVVYHSHQLEGRHSSGGVTGATHHYFVEAFDELQPTIPFLANTSHDEPNPEFVLGIDTETKEHNRTNAMISGGTLGLVPWFVHSDSVVRVSLKTPEGKKLISHQASSELRGVFHLLTIPFSPISLITSPGRDLYVDPMRSSIMAVAEDYARMKRSFAE